MNMGRLDNKTCFITGAGSGNGKAIAKALLEEGANVFSLEFSQVYIDEAIAELDGKVRFFLGDVTKEEDVKAAFAACIAEFGGVDILVNNAGIGIPSPDIAETDLAVLQKMVGVNMVGVFLCSREALKLMKPKGTGHILTLISMAGQRTNAGAPLYCASKFGARGLSGGIADQALKAGIKVTDVNPGPVNTNYWGDRDVPRDKFLQPADVGNVVRFILTLPDHVVVREIDFDSIHWLAK